MNQYENCKLCPRNCSVNRLNEQLGVCGMPHRVYIARYGLHKWEEPCISGENGSGTIFFMGCNLGCIYCQNYHISRRHSVKHTGVAVTVDELAQICLELQAMGAHNINLVTPTHYMPSIREGILQAKEQGLRIPIVYNTSGYEHETVLRQLEGIVDIYLTDFKYIDEEVARKYSFVNNYVEIVKDALQEMVRQQGKLVYNQNGLLQKGVIVRHLLLPNYVRQGKGVVDYILNTYGDVVLLSLMNQYTPLEQVKQIDLLNRRVTKREYERLVNYALDQGLVQGYIQEGETASESFIPDFTHSAF